MFFGFPNAKSTTWGIYSESFSCFGESLSKSKVLDLGWENGEFHTNRNELM